MKPTLITIWLAASVEVDEQTDGLSVLGIFNRIVLPIGAPRYDKPFTVFFSVTDVRVRTMCELLLRELSSLDAVYSRPVILDPCSPLEVTDMTVRINELPRVLPGAYTVELTLDGDPLGCTRLIVESDVDPEGEWKNEQ